jgi:hypothetical protein
VRPALGGPWQSGRNTKLRVAVMDRHPNEVIVWLDMDCIVQGDLHRSPISEARWRSA